MAKTIHYAENARQSLRIRTPDTHQLVNSLSGGNQQKVVIGKWLALGPKILLLDEPTRGIDVGAKEEVYVLMERLAADGRSTIFISSEFGELVGRIAAGEEIEHRLERFVGDFCQLAHRNLLCIVHQDVDPAERLARAGNRAFEIAGVTHVAAYG